MAKNRTKKDLLEAFGKKCPKCGTEWTFTFFGHTAWADCEPCEMTAEDLTEAAAKEEKPLFEEDGTFWGDSVHDWGYPATEFEAQYQQKWVGDKGTDFTVELPEGYTIKVPTIDRIDPKLEPGEMYTGTPKIKTATDILEDEEAFQKILDDMWRQLNS